MRGRIDVTQVMQDAGDSRGWEVMDKAQLYGKAPRKRVPYLLVTLAVGGVFCILSAAVTPLTGRYDAEVAFPEWGMKLADVRPWARTDGMPVAVVVGSSDVLHHVVPEELDAEVDRKGGKYRWYNMGVQETSPPELFGLAYELLEEMPDGACKLLVVDVLPTAEVGPEMGGLRLERTMDVAELIKRVRLLPWEEPGWEARNREAAAQLLRAWWNHGTGFLRAMPGMPAQKPHSTAAGRGWDALDQADFAAGRLRASREAFLASAQETMAHNVMIAKDFDLRRTLEDPMVNWDCAGKVRPILDQMQDLKQHCDREGIHVVFLFQKLWDANGCVYFEARERWGDAHVVEMMGYAGNEDLFRGEEAYDDDHFSTHGAVRFSQRLSGLLNVALKGQEP